MGFFSGLGKVLKGEPIYGPEPTKGDEVNHQAEQAHHEGKVVPVVEIRRIECSVNGDRMEVYGDLHNESHIPVYLDKIRLLGTVRELDTALQPEQARQFLLYRGAPLTQPPHGYAEVQYRTDTGDYFMSQHQIRVRQEGHEYHIHELEVILPVKDIQ